MSRWDADFYLNLQILTGGAKPFAPGRPFLSPEDDEKKKFEMGAILGDEAADMFENAGYDIWALNSVTIDSLKSARISTGIATEFPFPYVGLVLDRSSTGFKGIMRRAGVIDCGYRNEWMLSLFNSTPEPIFIQGALEYGEQAKACAQVVFMKYAKKKPTIVTELSKSIRGLNWEGSSDARSTTP